MTAQPKLLFDLKPAYNDGYCGIAQENRLFFNLFAEMEQISLNGLLFPNSPFFKKFKKVENEEQKRSQSSLFLNSKMECNTFKKTLNQKLKLFYLNDYLRKNYNVFPLSHSNKEVIWSNLFSKNISEHFKTHLLNQGFYYTDLSAYQLKVSSYFSKIKTLDTNGFDFILFYEPVPVKVSANTLKIVRFHDAIPITNPEFVSKNFSKAKLNALRSCKDDSFFICNSEPTLHNLLNIFPHLEKSAKIIPSILPNAYQKRLNFSRLQAILLKKLSKELIDRKTWAQNRNHLSTINEANFKYVFTLAALDPRKNHQNLIKAWKEIKERTNVTLKLVMAANPGWIKKEVKKEIKDAIEKGDIIHLSNVDSQELPFLFSHALCFIYPSFVEGFGLPPLEAMQCECPTIVSDIPSHRWVLHDATFYCDPYDPHDIANKIYSLLQEKNTGFKHELIKKGIERVKLYSQERLKEHWSQLFVELKAVRQRAHS